MSMNPDVERIATEIIAQDNKNLRKPLKPARSQAELIAVRQRYIQICLTGISAAASILTMLRVFGIV